ncbi:MAG: hypothetical protein ACLP9S_11775, partial [Syntrophales bacterium]
QYKKEYQEEYIDVCIKQETQLTIFQDRPTCEIIDCTCLSITSIMLRYCRQFIEVAICCWCDRVAAFIRYCVRAINEKMKYVGYCYHPYKVTHGSITENQ